MAKKSRSKINDERLRYSLLHRECVRRNPEYIRQYQELQEVQNKTERGMKESILISDWGLRRSENLPDPEERPDLNKLRRSKAETEIFLPVDFNLDPLISKVYGNVGFKIFDFLSEDMRKALKGVLLLVYIPEEPGQPSISAINTRWAKNEIEDGLLNSVGNIIAGRKKHGLKQSSSSEKLRVEEWFNYLWVYDLKKEGKKYREIADQLEKQSPYKVIDFERKARLYFQKAKDLIDKPPIKQALVKQLQERKQAMKTLVRKDE